MLNKRAEHDLQLSVYQQTLRLFSEDYRNFPLLPDDGFIEDLQLDNLDIEADLICNIAQQTQVELAYAMRTRLITVFAPLDN